MNVRSTGSVIAAPLWDTALMAGAIRPIALLVADVSAFTLATVLTSLLNSAPLARLAADAPPAAAAGLGWETPLMACALVLFFGVHRHYTSRTPFWAETAAILTGLAIGLFCDTFVIVILRDAPVRLHVAALRWLMLLPLVPCFRLAARFLLDIAGLWALPTLLVGEGTSLDAANRALASSPRLGYRVVGLLNAASIGSRRPDARWAELLQDFGAEFIILATGGGPADAERQLAASLARSRVPFAAVARLDGSLVAASGRLHALGRDMAIVGGASPFIRGGGQLAKAVLDRVAAGALLVLLSPGFLVLACAVALGGRPVIYGHERLGAGGRRFRCFKFRTMAVNADRLLADHLRDNAAAAEEWRRTQKLRSDPRVTRVGSFLRKYSLDELPQLLNVLRGEMSLVGPRPIVEAEAERYGEDIRFYFEAKPGITGLWQVSGRSETTYATRVRLDVWYVRNWSFWQDIALLAKTLPAVVRGKGAV